MKKIKKVDYEKVFFITMVLVSLFASCNNESKDSHNESEIKTDSLSFLAPSFKTGKWYEDTNENFENEFSY